MWKYWGLENLLKYVSYFILFTFFTACFLYLINLVVLLCFNSKKREDGFNKVDFFYGSLISVYCNI